MIGTSAASPPLDEAARLRATPAASWGAILAGAAVAISVSLILIMLGAGLGFASVSPWPEHGLSARGVTVAGTIWLIVTQWLSAAVGGYIAGRLRQRWLATHTHEVFFRDTAHGLVTWAVATLFVAAALSTSMTAMLGGGARALGGISAAAGQSGAMMTRTEMPASRGAPSQDSQGPGVYNLDKLFRGSSTNAGGSGGADAHGEVMHIAANVATGGELNDEDRTYLSNLVASKTGASADEAQRRVDAFIQTVKDASVQAKAAADAARKAAATAALYTALALLIGAFIASVSAALAGRLRDEHV